MNDLDGHPMGEGAVEEVTSQKEISTRVENDGAIVKHVAVSFFCVVKYSSGHGLLPLQSAEVFELTAVAIVVKQKTEKKAKTEFIEKLELPATGPCIFEIIKQQM